MISRAQVRVSMEERFQEGTVTLFRVMSAKIRSDGVSKHSRNQIPKFGEFAARDPVLFSLSLEGCVVAAELLS
jgi:hypothetical protein